MKHFYAFLLLLVCISTSLMAQTTVVTDSIIWQDFETDPTTEFAFFPVGDDTTWVNFDLDGLTPEGGLDEEKQWYWAPFFSLFIDTLTGDTIETNCMRSKSWMEGFAVGNRNWLILPPIEVVDAGYTLSWVSAPLQCPRYVDGYTVLISTTTNDAIADPNPFDQTLFQAAQMTDITGVSASIDPSNFEFSPGYRHADNFSNWEYLGLFNDGDSTLLTGYLEPHSVSLAAYSGQRVYIAFLHDADDDNQLAIDDILVLRTYTSGTEDLFEANLRLFTYPNPVVNNLNVLYRLDAPSEVLLTITDAAGRTIRQGRSQQMAGEQSVNMPLAALHSGAYTLTLTVNGRAVSRQFVKR
jgi:Secretion system C-terminal sorting domain/Cleaved Adhesin Domain